MCSQTKDMARYLLPAVPISHTGAQRPVLPNSSEQ